MIIIEFKLQAEHWIVLGMWRFLRIWTIILVFHPWRKGWETLD